MSGDEPLDCTVRAHTNLNTFACVKALMESGTVYGGVGSDAAAAIIQHAKHRKDVDAKR